ncbi:hypothetical protein COZ60_02950 [Candidatus Bathyarchaeota archaeon CG_4_8_14_3_um_filter_42_8]|nr:MAG: hypothetical protein COZ60_02950 [Candidatus Bathyarchaeota archaeon CG_4_8_14_3_um_filter_42_8]
MTIMVVVAIILLVLHWKGPNAVWGGATLGVIAGLIVALVTGDWGWLATIFAIATYAGTLFEWVGRLANYIKRRRG